MARENCCYFNQSHTSETEYCVQLKLDNITHDHRCFVLAEIVKPDTPISLNWSLLNISQSGLLMDIQLWWEVSAELDASTGRCQFEIQYKPSDTEHWNVMETLPGQAPPQPLYHFATGKQYLIRLRCVYHDVGNYSEFSDVLSVFLPTPQSVGVPLVRPIIIECRSPEQETFTCRWSPGSYQNLTQPRQLRFFYTKGSNADWRECPNYLPDKDSCYFNQTYTSIWVSYCVQLKSDIQDQNIIFDKRCFSIDNIVKPDPPISLNWTLLNVSQSGLLADIQMWWEPPPSADIKNGWISLKYEIQYRTSESNHWDSIEAIATSHPVYALATGKSYEIRLRCKQIANGDFSAFSEPLTIFIPTPPSAEEAGLLFRLFLIFASLGTTLMLFLVLYTKNQRLKLFFLPPVPVPKIKGIDSDLLKKGKMDEVNSIFANHLSYKSDLYIDDPWVEFIDIDLDGADGKMEVLDTDRLLGPGSPRVDAKDDDSGRDSCYEPDAAEVAMAAAVAGCKETGGQLAGFQLKGGGGGDVTAEAVAAGGDGEGGRALGEAEQAQALAQVAGCSPRPPTKSDPSPAAGPSQPGSHNSFGKMDFYAQVSDITPAGGVLLSPGQLSKAELLPDKGPSADKKPTRADRHREDDCSYTSEGDMKQLCGGEKSLNRSNYFTTDTLASTKLGDTRRPTLPVPDYTSIHMVDSQQSLLLNPNVPPSKCQASLAGYLMPEQLGNVIP
ncbi:growth hormone receptor-like [Rhinoraja longicauda]